MVLLILKPVQRLAEGQVRNDIEGQEGEPEDKVLRVSWCVCSMLVELGNQRIQVALDDVLLLADGLLREPGVQGTAVARVVGDAGSCDDIVRAFVRGDDDLGVLGGELPPAANRVDVLPGGDGVEGKFAGEDADDVAVLVVQLAVDKRQVTAELVPDVGQGRTAVELGAREASEGVEVEIVDNNAG